MYVIATAGHVDHGKSTLVRALTGMEPDRWAEERRRGMTIDLGYAWTRLASGADLAFVDVPGHERFIGNMLAGLGPAPAVLFVVAADEGWSRQSEEHLAAVDALRLRHGLLAVTRADLADPSPALRVATERIARSSLGDVRSLAVSGVTGAGLDELRDALDRVVTDLPAPATEARVRLWVDRAFTVRGSGTVVTGTLGAGRLRIGDELALGDRSVVVRGLQSLGQPHEVLGAVARVAVNLRGVAREDVRRGDVLCTPSAWFFTTEFDARLEPAGPGGELPDELVLHVGTAAVAARVRPLGPGLARLSLPAALPLQIGDRAILRDPGRHAVVAGLAVLDPDPPALRRRGAATARAGELAAAGGRPDVTAEIERRRVVSRQRLAAIGAPAPSAPSEASGLLEIAGWFVSPAQWDQWRLRLPGEVERWCQGHPLEPGVPDEALRRALGLPARELLGPLVDRSGLQRSEGRVLRPGPAATLGAADAALAALEQRLRDDPFAAPDAAELAGLRLGRRELGAAERAGRVIRVADGVVLLPSAPALAVAAARGLAQPFTVAAAREAWHTTRRVAVPLLEHLDALGLTERLADGTRRVVAAGSGQLPSMAPDRRR